jgi:hippurate hydrolase
MAATAASGRAIGLRADMDALPMTEFNTFAHASTHKGKMHACGHDGHTAMLLAAAQHLAQHRDFDGTVYLIFQPAEEGGGGAREMIKDGLFEQFPMEAVFGMHNWPGMAVGQFAVSPGPVMASSNEFKITITGKGGHAAAHGHRPGADRLPDGAGLADHRLAQQEAGGRGRDLGHHDPRRRGHQRDARRCEIQGTVRTFTYETLDLIERRMQEVAEGVAAAFGARCEFEFVRNYPPTINTAEADFCRQVMAGIVGADNALAQEPTMGAEDFAYMLQAKPGAYCFIANGDARTAAATRAAATTPGPARCTTRSYDFNDELIPLGATYWVRLAQAWLAHTPPADRPMPGATA